MKMKDFVISFVKACLDDDDGISENAYNQLIELRDAAAGFQTGVTGDRELYDELNRLMMTVDATDGRFYIKE